MGKSVSVWSGAVRGTTILTIVAQRTGTTGTRTTGTTILVFGSRGTNTFSAGVAVRLFGSGKRAFISARLIPTIQNLRDGEYIDSRAGAGIPSDRENVLPRLFQKKFRRCAPVPSCTLRCVLRLSSRRKPSGMTNVERPVMRRSAASFFSKKEKRNKRKRVKGPKG